MAIPDHDKLVKSEMRSKRICREIRSARIIQSPKGLRHKGTCKAWRRFRIRVLIDLDYKNHDSELMKKHGWKTRREMMRNLGLRDKYWKYNKYD